MAPDLLDPISRHVTTAVPTMPNPQYADTPEAELLVVQQAARLVNSVLHIGFRCVRRHVAACSGLCWLMPT